MFSAQIHTGMETQSHLCSHCISFLREAGGGEPLSPKPRPYFHLSLLSSPLSSRCPFPPHLPFPGLSVPPEGSPGADQPATQWRWWPRVRILPPHPQNDVTMQSKAARSPQCTPTGGVLQGGRTLLTLIFLEKCDGNKVPRSTRGTCVPWGADPASLGIREATLRSCGLEPSTCQLLGPLPVSTPPTKRLLPTPERSQPLGKGRPTLGSWGHRSAAGSGQLLDQ